jgi:methanogenic corrinoid protein MtbC1
MPRINDFPEDGKFNIKSVSLQTGLPPVTLRAWERRYQILNPQRAENGYRLYSEQDVALLSWLKDKVDAGLSISLAVADLKTYTRRGLSPEISIESPTRTERKSSSHSSDFFIKRLHDALITHDEIAAATVFEKAAASFDLAPLFEFVIIPVLVEIGDDWFNGRIKVATEHFASTFIRSRLMSIFQSVPTIRSSTNIMVGSAPDELHEIGPLMVAILLRQAGFRVEYLGPDLPLEDLAYYAKSQKPKMIILSATIKDSIHSLAGFDQQLQKIKPKPIFGFGGAAYVRNPELIGNTPGVFLGETISQSIQTVQDVLAGKKRLSLAG